MSSNNSSLSLAVVSLNTIRSYLVPQLLFVGATSLNLVCCVAASLILWRGKFFTGRMFVLLRLFFLNDSLVSICVCSIQLWHIYNNVSGGDELYTRTTCFWINGLQFFFVINNNLISMTVALDRLQFSLNPTKVISKYFQPSCSSLSMLIVPLVLSGLLYISALLDTEGGNALMVYCSARNSTGPNTTMLLWASIFLISIGTMLLYVFMLMAACCRKTKVEAATNDNTTNQKTNNVAVIQAKMFKKLSRNLAITTIVYFFVGPLPNGLSTVFATQMPTMLLSVGLYYGWLTFVEGSVYTFTLLLSRQFRQEFAKLFGAKPVQ